MRKRRPSVREKIERLTKLFRDRHYPPSLYDFAEGEGVVVAESALVEEYMDQGPSLCGLILDQKRRVVEFDIEFFGADPYDTPLSSWGHYSDVNEWTVRSTQGDWWWKEEPRQTGPDPNNRIYVAMQLLDSEVTGE